MARPRFEAHKHPLPKNAIHTIHSYELVEKKDGRKVFERVITTVPKTGEYYEVFFPRGHSAVLSAAQMTKYGLTESNKYAHPNMGEDE